MSKIKLKRLKKKVKLNKFKYMLILLSISLLCVGIAYAGSKTDVEINGSAKIKEYSCVNVSGEFTSGNPWSEEGKYVSNVTLSIHNDSMDDIVGWEIKIFGPSDLDSRWVNADKTYGDGYLLLKNLPYNSTITSKGDLELQFGLETVEEQLNIKQIVFNNCVVYKNDDISTDFEDDTTLQDLFITPSRVTINTGETYNLSLVLVPTTAIATITWESSNPRVAEVKDGIVTAKTAGEADIIAKSGFLKSVATIIVKKNEDDPEYVAPDLAIEMNVTNSWGSTMQYDIDIENIGESPISSFSFVVDLPEGTSYTIFYYPGLVIDGNLFNINLSNPIQPGETSRISGQATIPAGYNINDYNQPNITKIINE